MLMRIDHRNGLVIDPEQVSSMCFVGHLDKRHLQIVMKDGTISNVHPRQPDSREYVDIDAIHVKIFTATQRQVTVDVKADMSMLIEALKSAEGRQTISEIIGQPFPPTSR